MCLCVWTTRQSCVCGVSLYFGPRANLQARSMLLETQRNCVCLCVQTTRQYQRLRNYSVCKKSVALLGKKLDICWPLLYLRFCVTIVYIDVYAYVYYIFALSSYIYVYINKYIYIYIYIYTNTNTCGLQEKLREQWEWIKRIPKWTKEHTKTFLPERERKEQKKGLRDLRLGALEGRVLSARVSAGTWSCSANSDAERQGFCYKIDPKWSQKENKSNQNGAPA